MIFVSILMCNNVSHVKFSTVTYPLMSDSIIVQWLESQSSILYISIIFVFIGKWMLKPITLVRLILWDSRLLHAFQSQKHYLADFLRYQDHLKKDSKTESKIDQANRSSRLESSHRLLSNKPDSLNRLALIGVVKTTVSPLELKNEVNFKSRTTSTFDRNLSKPSFEPVQCLDEGNNPDPPIDMALPKDKVAHELLDVAIQSPDDNTLTLLSTNLQRAQWRKVVDDEYEVICIK